MMMIIIIITTGISEMIIRMAFCQWQGGCEVGSYLASMQMMAQETIVMMRVFMYVIGMMNEDEEELFAVVRIAGC